MPVPDLYSQHPCNVRDYLQAHRGHINYDRFKALSLPLGSEIVESAYKWLIQQRFKELVCVGVKTGLTIYCICVWCGSTDGDYSSQSSPNRAYAPLWLG